MVTEANVHKVIVFGLLLGSASILLASSGAARFETLQAKFSSGVQPALLSPMRISPGPPGQVLVSDSRTNNIVAVDEVTRTPIWSFAVEGSPMAIGFVSNLVVVGNVARHAVEVYRLRGARTSPDLDFQFALGFPPPEGNIRTPSDLAIDKDAGLVFVLDSGARSVRVFSLGGSEVDSFPPPQSAVPLLSPTAIALDPVRQEVLVSDYGDPNGYFSVNVAARIMVYTYAGEYVTQIDGGVAVKSAQFARPQGLAVDAQGRVFMAESLIGQVFVFDRTTGALLEKLGGFGDGPGELMLPLDLLIDRKSRDLMVTNNMAGRIEVFRGAGGLQ